MSSSYYTTAAVGGLRLPRRAVPITSPPPMSSRVSYPLQLSLYNPCSSTPQRRPNICPSSFALTSSSSSEPASFPGTRQAVRRGKFSIPYSPSSQLHCYSPITGASSEAGVLGEGEELDQKCGLAFIGLNVETAPAVMREKLLLPDEDYSRAIQPLLSSPFIKEVLVLSSTPSYLFQVYAVVQPTSLGIDEVITWLSQRSGVPLPELNQHIVVHKGDKAVRHLLEAAVDDLVLPRESFSFFVLSRLMMGSLAGGLGVILSELVSKAFCLMDNRLSAPAAISLAAYDIAQDKVLNTMTPECTPKIVVVGLNSTTKLLMPHLFRFNHPRREIVVVCHDYELEDDEYKRQFEGVDISSRPMSQLLSSVSEAHLIFIASPNSSDGPLLSNTDIEGLPPSNRVFIDMCHPPSIGNSRGGPLSSASVFNINDIIKVMDSRTSKLRSEISEMVEDFRLRMEEAVNVDGSYPGEAPKTEPLRSFILRDAMARNVHEKKKP